MWPPKEKAPLAGGLPLHAPGQVTWNPGSLVGGDMPYLQGLGQPNEIPLHLLTGLQLSLQPHHFCLLF